MTRRWIFLDFDNTLMGTEALLLPSLVQRFNDLHDLGMTVEDFKKHFHGMSYKALCDAVGQHYSVAINFHAVFHDREWAMMEYSREHGIPMANGVPDIFPRLSAQGFRFALTTNNSLQRCLAAMRYATNGRGEELAAYFGTYFFQAGDAQKPKPDVYLHAIVQCGADAAHSVAVEDSVTGVTASVTAGLKTFGYLGYADHKETQEEKLLAAGAVACFDSWDNFPALLEKV